MREPVDLRSDTVTLPTPGMRRAMANARVGDARRGEDPTVRELEEVSAFTFAKEAALFVPSGTMGNLVSVAAWTRPQDLVLASCSSHIAGREMPWVSLLAAVSLIGIETPKGYFSAKQLEAAIEGIPASLRPKVRLVCAENTHNAAGGRVFPVSSLRRIRSWCRKQSIRFHIDGSRIFNASIASGVGTAEYGACCDSLMFCLSKGLGGPVGSVVVGRREFIGKAREVCFRIGGGMRQAGIVAAGGLYALRRRAARLAEDHENARTLARVLGEIRGIEVINEPVETNIVLFRWGGPVTGQQALRDRLRKRGVLLDDRNYPVFRAVTHLGIGKREIARAARALREVFGR